MQAGPQGGSRPRGPFSWTGQVWWLGSTMAWGCECTSQPCVPTDQDPVTIPSPPPPAMLPPPRCPTGAPPAAEEPADKGGGLVLHRL